MAEINGEIFIQLKNALCFMCFGAASAFCSDVLGVWRRRCPGGRLRVHLQDILFVWLLSGTFFALLLKYNHGQFRLYFLLSMVCGALLYRLLFETLTVKILEKIVLFLCLLTGFFAGLFLSPVKKITFSMAKSLKNIRRTVKIVKSRF
ncbi:MAG: spore cortex biosynthesis protein YabQ [Eubacterium sp.]|nr:spore cortex biosynthesis protein YabQ [Eubacterium sp.]